MPMDPEYLPEAALLLGGIIAGAIALRLLFTRQFQPALRVGAASVACIALAFVLGKSHGVRVKPAHWQQWRKPPKSLPLVPATRDSTDTDHDTMSLVLGGVLLRVAPSDRYVLTVDKEQVLVLDSLRTGLIVDCVVGVDDRAAATINRNLFPFFRSGIRPSRPNAHTLLVQDEGKDIFKVYYAEPRRIEITGQLLVERYAQATAISLVKGIYWPGGGIPSGTSIDLRHQGKGRIDFARSGMIQVVPEGRTRGVSRM